MEGLFVKRSKKLSKAIANYEKLFGVDFPSYQFHDDEEEQLRVIAKSVESKTPIMPDLETKF